MAVNLSAGDYAPRLAVLSIGVGFAIGVISLKIEIGRSRDHVEYTAKFSIAEIGEHRANSSDAARNLAAVTGTQVIAFNPQCNAHFGSKLGNFVGGA